VAFLQETIVSNPQNQKPKIVFFTELYPRHGLTELNENNKIFLNVNTYIVIKKHTMKFRDFQILAKNLPAFNLNDIRKLDPGFHRQQLNDWCKRGYVQPIAGGYYLFTGTEIDETFLFMLANRIYEPSYISRESALAYYHIIPESVLGVTSASSRKTKQFDSQWVRFLYYSIKPTLMFGYHVVTPGKLIQYKIATLEKAVLDYLYWNSNIQSVEEFEGLRWNREELLGLIDNQLFKQYLVIFAHKALNHRVNLLMEYLHA